ncbi:hypothetical protein LR48_Vigan08g204600 [Vigna angularis]|uniref:B box-type domain-containing protein n=2 Tax=Phaseolus angularis TaxID=3914 RepID=A0A0L9V985_PHAAN|nr:zinc finger protein CONSTANS-LIKE 3 [Vigna angularis]KOM51219.1 hypothetical protein LR48_Vigan08g204600 [Vigna angularis]BAT91263.1 hypothetical protein VIGAN_06257900 [Vigna angularis var. angularis]
MEESCALCKKRAAMLCDADQAKLCWECDGKVHSANFLVARHSRVLLCRSCHSLTPWKASGTKLTPSISFCQPCLGDRTARLRLLVNDVRQPQKEGENEAPPPSSASATSPPRPAALPLRNHSSSIDSHDETACSSSQMLDANQGSRDGTSEPTEETTKDEIL